MPRGFLCVREIYEGLKTPEGRARSRAPDTFMPHRIPCLAGYSSRAFRSAQYFAADRNRRAFLSGYRRFVGYISLQVDIDGLTVSILAHARDIDGIRHYVAAL
jgi:hypothetical protein